MGGDDDAAHQWAWNGCFLGVVALLRFENRFAGDNPRYVALRGRLRLVLTFIAMFVVSHSDEANTGRAVLVAAIATALVYVVLRLKMLRFVWHMAQATSWMRKAAEPSPLMKPQP